ncbi:hypothetical protein [Algiphilus aromaticivorans]|uniref:hypothetical protein n=1 Tax=Algiphilus aromaticivorans TaxID=382454 RepID=UPI0005C163A5|nr:hypothetical protein [Algiphilus aromaticivorans]
MSVRNDGGPAFAHGNPDQGGAAGMSMRDYFAAKVMHALITRLELKDDPKKVPGVAYAVADAMLKARESTP